MLINSSEWELGLIILGIGLPGFGNHRLWSVLLHVLNVWTNLNKLTRDFDDPSFDL